jgi:hypothetical protein
MHGMREWNLLPTSLMTGFGVYFSAKYRFRILDKNFAGDDQAWTIQYYYNTVDLDIR